MHETRRMELVHPRYVRCEQRERSITLHVYVRTSLFSCFCLLCLGFFCRNLTLPSFKKGVFVRNGYFSPISVEMK